jgi:hypothetical protein
MFAGRRKLWIIGGVVLALAIVAGGAGAVVATGAGDDDRPIEGAAYDESVAAALEHTGGGEVIETEIGDDGAAYGVEVRLDDGRVVEVNLDENFEVIGQENDDDGSEGEGADDD